MTPETIAALRKSARELFGEVWRENIRPKRVRRPSKWAVEERFFEVGQSPLSTSRAIRFNHAVMPHCVEPMDAADDQTVNIIALMWGRRMGKTENVCMNVLGRTVTEDQGNIFCMLPIEKSAEKFSRDVLNPTIEITPALRDRFFEAKSRDAGRTKFYLRFFGGSIYIMFPGSGASTRGSAVKVIFIGEVDDEAYADAKEGIGDVVERALGRSEGFADAIKIIESTPTLTSTLDEAGRVKYRSRIAYWHDRGDKRKWFCQCKKCGQLQWLKFEQIKHVRGFEHAEYICERCDAAHNEKAWRDLVRGGKWFPTAGLTDAQLLSIEANAGLARAKDPVVRSYWINGFNSLLPRGKGYKTKLHQFVAEHARAAEKPGTLQVWTNEVKTELWNPDTELEAPPDWKPLYERREGYATGDEDARIIVPGRALVLTSGIDVHPDRVEASWVGWGRREESFVLDHVVIDGDTHKGEVWGKLKRELQRDFDHESGAKIALSFALIDASYGAEDVLQFLRGRPVAGKIRACRGASKFPHPLIDKRYRTLAGNLKGHWIGGDAAKDILYTRLRLVALEDGSLPDGWIHFAKRLEEIYFEQLTAERVTVEDGGARRYHNEDHLRNETLDTFVYAFAAFRRRLWNWKLIEAEILERAAIAKSETSAAGQPKPVIMPARKPRMRSVQGLM